MIVADISAMDWSQFGLAGLVIAALFAALLKIVTFGISKLDGIDTRHNQTISKLSEDHRAERTEWRDHTDKRSDETNAVIKELTEVVKEIGKGTK